VRVEDAKAQLGSNTVVRSRRTLTINRAKSWFRPVRAQVQRGQEKINLTQFEKVTIPSNGAFQRSNVLAPPDRVAPLNLSPIIAENPKISPVRFEWKPVQDAVSYTCADQHHVDVTKTGKDPTVKGTAVDITGLDPGDYFGTVTATDGKKETSEVSEIVKLRSCSRQVTIDAAGD